MNVVFSIWAFGGAQVLRDAGCITSPTIHKTLSFENERSFFFRSALFNVSGIFLSLLHIDVKKPFLIPSDKVITITVLVNMV